MELKNELVETKEAVEGVLTGTEEEKKELLEKVGIAIGTVYHKKAFLEQNLEKAKNMAEMDVRQFDQTINEAFKLMMGYSITETAEEAKDMVETLEEELDKVNEWLDTYKFDENAMKAVAIFFDIVNDQSTSKKK